ncbi:hypothetical protein [Marinomonas sp.]|uniref:hypothetical protein n=1 Tax=Marinomonas sp. TaxID=1904862 RepID=UPI003C76858D
MSKCVLDNVNATAKKYSFVCLFLFALSLFFSTITTNSMLGASSSSSMAMDTTDPILSDEGSMPHDSLRSQDSRLSHAATMTDMHCVSQDCNGMSTHHDHQDCMDNHCSSFSGLLASYDAPSVVFSSIQPVLAANSYRSTYPNTPYFPPIALS